MHGSFCSSPNCCRSQGLNSTSRLDFSKALEQVPPPVLLRLIRAQALASQFSSARPDDPNRTPERSSLEPLKGKFRVPESHRNPGDENLPHELARMVGDIRNVPGQRCPV